MSDAVSAERKAKRVGIIGAGAWGTAIAKSIADKGHIVKMWSYEEDVARGINTEHENAVYLPNVRLPESVTAGTEIIEAATDADFIIIATPSLHALRSVRAILQVPNIQEGSSHIGVVTKGFIDGPQGPRLIVETLENYLPGFYKNTLVYISGPSHAEEVATGKITGLISASQSPKNAIRFRELLASESLLVFSSLDVIGVQVCAAVKNVIAIAFGMLDALKEVASGFGDNTESLLLAAGLNEIQSLGMAMGSTHPETFTSIAGVGDLDVTCRSVYGRNRRFGREIVLEKKIAPYASIDQIIASIDRIGYLPEGLVAARYVNALAAQLKIRMPISQGVYQILDRQADPEGELMHIFGV